MPVTKPDQQVGVKGVWPLVLSCAVLTAQSVAADGVFVLEVSSLPGHVQRPGATGLYESFLGGWDRADSLDDLDVDNGLTYGGPGQSISFGYRHYVAPGWSLRIGAQYGEALYDLPDGIDIFVDPAEIHLSYLSLTTEIAREVTQFSLADRAGDITLGLGVHHSAIKAHIISDLLDVEDESRATHTVLRLGAEWSLLPQSSAAPIMPALGADLRLFDSGDADLVISLRALF